MNKRVTIDPVTRIEGHLRVDVEVDGGRVKKAWASGQMWRGVENILIGRDPRDAWAITQRICGVCTTVHAIASVRAVENALQLEIPVNAQYIRNMIILAHAVHDHIVHFYHLSALDWVDVVSAMKADPAKTASLAESLSSWSGNSVQEFNKVQDKIKGFVGTGQLGIFTNGYWGHPAMKLTPEVNLLAVSHYLQALEVQRYASKIVAVLGSKSPHIQNVAVGGVANPLATDAQSVLTIERLLAVKEWMLKLEDFVKNVYLIDVGAIGGFYADWTKYGKGITDYLSVPDIPLDGKGTQFALPGGYIEGGKLESYKPIKTFNDQYFTDGVSEAIKHSWYNYSAGHEPTKKYATAALDLVSKVAGAKVGVDALHSTIGRHAARAVGCAVQVDELINQWDLLLANMAKGDLKTFNRPVFPKGEQMGVGFHEAPRGVLSHWVVIDSGKIKNYQCVVPTTWNAAPRNEKDQPGAYEACLIDNPVADPEKPLEVLRTVHSFDPCLACAVHVVDQENNPVVTVKAV